MSRSFKNQNRNEALKAVGKYVAIHAAVTVITYVALEALSKMSDDTDTNE